jgi:hypothetical protein
MSGTEGIPATHGEEDVKCMTTDRGEAPDGLSSCTAWRS